MQDDKKREILEQKREFFNRKMDERREKVNAMFDQKQAQMGGVPNDRQAQIVDAALEQLKVDGLNNLSLRDIARRAGIQAPALYWHFKNKEDLIDYMAEAILQKEFTVIPLRAGDQTWQDWLTQHMSQLRRAMLAYPDGGRVVAGAHLYPALTLGRSFEAALTSMESDGINLGLARSIIMTATHYTFGSVIEEQAAPNADQISEARVSELLQPYPKMREVMSEVWQNENIGEDDYFLTGLRMIIAGSTQNTGQHTTQ